MPWPGPHIMRSIHKFFVPGPIEMQSSPVLITELVIATSDDNCTCIPSVFGLFPEAMTLTPSICTFLHPLTTIWNIWLFNDTNPLILMFMEFVILNVCNKKYKFKISIWTLKKNGELHKPSLYFYIFYALVPFLISWFLYFF